MRQVNWLIFVHVGSEDALVAGPRLTYEAGSVDGENDGRTNRTNFENWAKETLIPNIPEEHVVVFNSAPFHYTQADKLQSEYAAKAEMISRLREAEDWLDATMMKHQLTVQDYSVKK